MTPAILFLTGASGSGKTTVVRALRARDPRGVYLHFDSIGVPHDATMVREFGSGEEWQAEMTRRWVARIVTEHASSRLVVIEGQARPRFIESALVQHRVTQSAIVLVHCDDREREARLEGRGQPELANARVRSWAAFLQEEARARNILVIDTTKISVADAVEAVLEVGRGLTESSPR